MEKLTEKLKSKSGISITGSFFICLYETKAVFS